VAVALPLAGPLTFIAKWPKYGIGESAPTVDAGKLREAAERADNRRPTLRYWRQSRTSTPRSRRVRPHGHHPITTTDDGCTRNEVPICARRTR
jgi:hypothetical protein